MDDATNDGINAYAVIKGVTVGQGGTSASLTAPNGTPQDRLLYAALDESGMTGSDIDYLEAHGTGTSLGDPIEMGALSAVMGEDRHEENPLVMGGVKSNIGHLEPASGIAVIIKAILVLQHEQAPTNALLKILNPNIAQVVGGFTLHFPVELDKLRIYSCKFEGEALVAGVISFGYEGKIVHVVIGQVLVSMQRSPVRRSLEKGAMFMFTGQGAQYEGMGRGLYDNDEVFRIFMKICEKHFNTKTGESLLNLVYPDLSSDNNLTERSKIGGLKSKLGMTKYTQPALFAVEWSLSEMWQSKGVEPCAVFGHSIGEITAACVVGDITVETGMDLVIKRGSLIQDLPSNNGVMYALGCSREVVEDAIYSMHVMDDNAIEHVYVAAVNGPESVVISGLEDEVDYLLRNLDDKCKAQQKLNVSHAFHSPLMRPIVTTLDETLKKIDCSPCKIPLVSTVSGLTVMPGDVLRASHWLLQITDPVLFSKAIEAALGMKTADGLFMVSSLLEIGPTPILTRMARPWINDIKSRPLIWESSLDGKGSTSDMDVISKAHLNITDISRVLLNKQSYPWAKLPHPFLQQSSIMTDKVCHTAIFHETLMSLMKDHTIGGRTILPGTGYVEFALAAMMHDNTSHDGIVHLNGVSFLKPFDLDVGCKLICEVEEDGGITFHGENDNTNICMVSESYVDYTSVPVVESEVEKLDVIKNRCKIEITGMSKHYADLAQNGFHGPQFQTLKQVWQSEDKKEFVASLHVPDLYERYHVHPALLDGVVQLVGFVDNHDSNGDMKSFVPAAIGEVSMMSSIGRHQARYAVSSKPIVWAHARVNVSDSKSRILDFVVYDGLGDRVVLVLKRFRFGILPALPPPSALYEVSWVESPLPLNMSLDSNLDVEVLDVPGLESSSKLVASLLDTLENPCMLKSLYGISESSIVIVPAMMMSVSVDVEGVLLEVIGLLKHLTAMDTTLVSHVVVLTMMSEGSLVLNGGATQDGIGGGAIWGLLRTAMIELPKRLNLLCIDIDADTLHDWKCKSNFCMKLKECLFFSDGFKEVAYRSCVRYIRKVTPSSNILKAIAEVDGLASLSELNDVVLVTGGLGGLGIVTAETLVELGVRHIVLVSRSGSVKYADQGLEERINVLLNMGVNIRIERCDIGQEDDVISLLDRVRMLGPIKAVVHAAGVIYDALLINQNTESLSKVYKPKADGAWFLHKHTMSDRLASFVMYSSLSSLLGYGRNGNYSSANAYLDELSHWRASRGLVALSIQWPAVEGVGMAAAMDERVKIDRSLSIDCKTVKQVIQQLIFCNCLISPVQVVLPRGLLEESATPIWCKSLFDTVAVSNIEKQNIVSDIRKGRSKRSKRKVSSSKTAEKNVGMTTDRITAEVLHYVKELVDLDAETINTKAPMMEMGLDSLASAQLVQSLNEIFDLKLPPTVLFDYPTIDALVKHLCNLFAHNVVSKEEYDNIPILQEESSYSENKTDWDTPLVITQGRIEGCLICLQEGIADSVPVVLLHAGHGGLIYGTQLIPHVGKNLPLYCIQAPELRRTVECGEGLKWRVKFYFSVLQNFFSLPRGVHLVGYSFGAILAWEISLLLQTNGIPFTLTMLDPVPTYVIPVRANTTEKLMKRADFFELFVPNMHLQEAILKKVVKSNWDMDLFLFKFIKSDGDLMCILQEIADVVSKVTNECCEQTHFVSHCIPKIFMTESGLQWFKTYFGFEANLNSEAERDNVHGWSSRFETVDHTSVKGTHLEFFHHESNVMLLAEHLKILEKSKINLPSDGISDV